MKGSLIFKPKKWFHILTLINETLLVFTESAIKIPLEYSKNLSSFSYLPMLQVLLTVNQNNTQTKLLITANLH